jgi:hypothetical protein
MKTNIHFRSYLAHSFLEWEMFLPNIVEKLETRILCSITFFSKIVPFMRFVGKYCRAEQPTEDNGNMGKIGCKETSANNYQPNDASNHRTAETSFWPVLSRKGMIYWGRRRFHCVGEWHVKDSCALLETGRLEIGGCKSLIFCVCA